MNWIERDSLMMELKMQTKLSRLLWRFISLFDWFVRFFPIAAPEPLLRHLTYSVPISPRSPQENLGYLLMHMEVCRDECAKQIEKALSQNPDFASVDVYLKHSSLWSPAIFCPTEGNQFCPRSWYEWRKVKAALGVHDPICFDVHVTARPSYFIWEGNRIAMPERALCYSVLTNEPILWEGDGEMPDVHPRIIGSMVPNRKLRIHIALPIMTFHQIEEVVAILMRRIRREFDKDLVKEAALPYPPYWNSESQL